MVLLTLPYARELSICRGVAGYEWIIYSNSLCMTPSFTVRYSGNILASADDDIILRVLVDITCTSSSFIKGWTRFFVKKK